MRGSEPPEDGYAGDYVPSSRTAGRRGPARDLDELARRGTEAMRERIETLERFGVQFDTWSSERDLHEARRLGDVEALRAGGHTYQSEGACGLRTGVRRRQGPSAGPPGGEPTYFAADIAYHRDKLRAREPRG